MYTYNMCWMCFDKVPTLHISTHILLPYVNRGLLDCFTGAIANPNPTSTGVPEALPHSRCITWLFLHTSTRNHFFL